MSKADDLSLLAMQAARMSTAAIAATMGWGLERATKRLQDLNGGAEPGEAVVVAFAPAAPGMSPSPVDALDEKPLGEGEALVLRSFSLRAGGYGADCLLGDGRRVFTVTGRDRQDPTTRIRVEQIEAADVFPPMPAAGEDAEPAAPQTGLVWRMARARADA